MPFQGLHSKEYVNVALLIIDEVGFPATHPPGGEPPVRWSSYRYERDSNLITTNKAVKDLPEVLTGDEVTATALLDPLRHHAHVSLQTEPLGRTG